MVLFFFKGRRAQGSPEFSVVISFVMLMFLIVLLIAFQKQSEAYSLQVFLDAKKVSQSVADNINMISKNGHGYYRYFSVPKYLYGYTDYNLWVGGNFLEMSYSNHTWATSLVTNNVSIIKMEKGESKTNCISNEGGEVVINTICGFSDQGCGQVHSCDPGDVDTCPTCDSPDPPEVYKNSQSFCPSYGCNTSEWHFYKVIPDRSGILNITFASNGTMLGDDKTDLIFYDYTANGCSSPQQVFQLEPSTESSFIVQAGRTYIIALDVDSTDCAQGGRYWLRTVLT